MTSEGLGEMFEGDSADTCAEKFPLVSMGDEQRVSRAQTQELGPPSFMERYVWTAPRSPSSSPSTASKLMERFNKSLFGIYKG